MIDALEAIGALDDTVFVVMSDNGASQEGSQVGTLHQGRYFERAPMTMDGSISLIDEIGETQWFNNYPLGWAMAGNTPCKFYKQNTHGGGVRDPLVVHWPAGLPPTSAGTMRHQFHHVSDLVPTILEIADVVLPDTVNGVAQMPLHGTPMTYTFTEPTAPTRKLVQHFEMLGHRGIVADGWKAVTLHDARTSLDDDVWELYDIDADFSETVDLAESHPDKLRDLIALWWEQAERYKVLPVDERGGGGTRQRRPVRTEWTLWPGLERLPSDAAPRLVNTSHTITAHITVPDGGCHGALIADGDRWGGYAMFVQDGRACFHYHFPLERHETRATDPLAPGDHAITWTFTKTDRLGGRGALAVDGSTVGAVDIPRMMRGFMPFTGMSVGCDNVAPVATTYESPFRFTGELHRVEIRLLGDEPGPDASAEHRTEMGKQ
jgi:arylsulfatase